MKRALVLIVLIVLAVLAAWWWSVRQDQGELEQVAVIPGPEIRDRVDPPKRYPVEDITPPAPEPQPEVEPEPPPPPEPLPTLAESDPEVRERAIELLPDQDIESLLVPDYLLSRIVSTVDALDTRRVAMPVRPVGAIPGRFEVLQSGDEAVISPANAERYTPYVRLLEAADPDQLVGLYLRYYPLLQEAYLGLGYQEVYFNDRVVDMLDLLLATPEPQGLIPVVQNEAVWEFADPELEALPVGQKALLRLSAEDRAVVKARLRDLRDALAGANPALSGD